MSAASAMAWPYLRATSGCRLLKEITSESVFTVCPGIVALDALVPGPNSLLARYALRSRLKPKSSTVEQDRKSTRLNSSHGYISYAVFCLKKKKMNMPQLGAQALLNQA